MAIRKDLDDMLNSLMDSGGGSSNTPARSHNTPRSVRKSKFDDMSVDDLLHALEDEKRHSSEEAAPAEDISDDTPPSVWEFAPPTESAPEPEPQEEEEEVQNIISEVMHTEASAEMTRVFDTIPMTEEFPKPAKKKKIVITGELPDYEALRREEAEREKQAKLAAEAAAEEARAAERARRAAEAAAERQRLAEEAEQRRLARIEAENQRRAEEERQRIEEEAERARRIAEAAAEKKRLAEEAERQRLAEEAERARLAEEEAERQRLLAEEAERQRIAEEEAERARIAQEEERLRRIEEMKRLAEEAESKEPSPVTFDEETIVNSSSDNAVDEAIESLGEAAEAPAENITPEVQEEAEKPKKLGFFKKLMNIHNRFISQIFFCIGNIHQKTATASPWMILNYRRVIFRRKNVNYSLTLFLKRYWNTCSNVIYFMIFAIIKNTFAEHLCTIIYMNHILCIIWIPPQFQWFTVDCTINLLV